MTHAPNILLLAKRSRRPKLTSTSCYQQLPFPAFLTSVTLPFNSTHVSSLQICRTSFFVRVRVSATSRSVIHHLSSPSPQISLSASSERLQENLTNVSESVIKAVESLSKQPRQTVEDIAATAGLSIANATDEAVKLATLTGASIDVTDQGDIAYRFPSNVRAILRARSFRASFIMTWRRIAPAVFLVGRVAFGALLILSIAITFIAIAAISSAGHSDDDRQRHRGSHIAPRLFFGPDLFDTMLYPRPYSYRSSYYPGTMHTRRANGQQGMSFLESVYSFVFGDGDPNLDFEQRRWKSVAALIRANRGALTAEQLAPLLDPPLNRDDSTNVVDESFVLPALTRFHGHPEVTESGDIIYVFPSFMKTGARFPGSVEIVGTRSSSPVLEQEVKLTGASDSQRIMVLALGAINLLGVILLGGKLMSAVPVTRDAAQFILFVRSLYPTLLTYAASFFVIPILRWLGLRRKNAKIRERNLARTESARILARGGIDVRRKIRAAESYVVRDGSVRTENVVYSSDRDAFEQRRWQDDMIDEFDRRLNKKT